MFRSKSVIAFFLMTTCLQVKLSAAKVTPIEVENSNQELAKLMIGKFDEALTDILRRFPDNISDKEFEQIIEDSFQNFYIFITATRPKAEINAIIMYLQYAELIFKHGATSKLLQLKDIKTRKDFFYQFLLSWENKFASALEPIQESLYDVIINTKN